MKSRINIALATTIALILGTPMAVRAQTQSTKIFDVETPFEFTVGKNRLPAGHYTVSRLGSNFLLFRSHDGKATAMASMMATVDADESASKVLFNKYGDVYFLSEVRRQADHHHLRYACNQSDAEKKLASQGSPQIVTVRPTQ